MYAKEPKSDDKRDYTNRIADLSPSQLGILARRLQDKKKAAAQKPAIPRRSAPSDPAPLSFSQERLWFLNQLEPDNSAMNMHGKIRLKGALNLAAVEQTLSEVIRRHEILRTTYHNLAGEPVQVIAPAEPRTMPVVDLTELSESEREAHLQRLSMKEGIRPLNLTTDWTVRPTLLRLCSREVALFLTAHHIAFDAWAWDLFYQERAAVYNAFSSGNPSTLADPEIQYADYAVWQREWLQGEVLDKQLSYWKQHLGDSAPALEMPTDRPRAARQGFRHGKHGIVLSRNLAEGLSALTQRESGTLFMTMFAAFCSLLYRHTQQQTITVGTLISNRNRSQTESLLGFFLNTLALRLSLSGEPSFRDLVKRVRQITLGGYAHSDVPFEKLLETLRPERDAGLAPLFRVLFSMGSAVNIVKESTDLNMEATDDLWESYLPNHKKSVSSDWIHVDLALSVEEMGPELAVTLKYNANLFDETTIIRLIEHFRNHLSGIIADPDQRITDLSLLMDAERHHLLTEWNDTQTQFDQSECFEDLFEAQAQLTADAVAVVSEDAHLTYGELNRRAENLSYLLSQQGVGQDDLVAILSRRSIEFLTLMLAAFKTGGAYLPLDPSNPPHRLGKVLSRSKPSLVLSTNEFEPVVSQALEWIDETKRPQALRIETLIKKARPAENRGERFVPSNRSYVIFTSGSTGEPKGAMVEQAGMLNHLRAKISDLRITARDTVAQTASQSFDISVWQFLAALLVGGKVRIVDDTIAHDPSELMKLVGQEAITILETVPSLLQAMLDSISTTNKPDTGSLRWLLVTGEALPPQLCHKMAALYPGLPLLNAYGPTECSDDVTHCVIGLPESAHLLRAPIGRPILNMQTYVLDTKGTTIPMGAFGELHIGGAGVGRGYLDEPGRTAEVFIPDPFSKEYGARLYKTGDVARYQPDGRIEFIDRIDHQVKLRGFRIELNEIEAVLRQFDRAQQAVVLVRDDSTGGQRLVAYVVAKQGEAPTANQMRDFLNEHLPEYMIPSIFVLLDSLPLTANGKIDRRALPAPDESSTSALDEFVAPDGLLENKLAEIWSEILKIERIGIYDNFFHLGGHSLMAIQVIHRINQAFKANLSVRNLFEEPTIAGLALTIEEMFIEDLEEGLETT